MKNDSIEDVKKNNTLRRNFQNELKKINDSKKSGAVTDDVYQPSSWLFEELSFLKDLEKPIKSVCSIDDKVENRDEEITVRYLKMNNIN